MDTKPEPKNKKAKDDLQYKNTEPNEANENNNYSDAPENHLAKLKEKLHECEKLQKEYLDGWQRAKADFINYKKDEAKRFGVMAERALDDILHDILIVLDSFHMARQYEMPVKVAEGIAMIQSQLEDVLRRRGLTTIKARGGDAFDPRIHESVGEIESSHPPGIIAEETQKGYELNGRVLRPARVKLSKEKNN